MRHRVAGRTLGRKTAHRRAMWRNMAISLFTHGQITTTLPKAKSLKPFVERLITIGKKGDLTARRRITSLLGRDQIIVRSEDDEDVVRNSYGEVVGGPKIVKLIVEDIAPRYRDREGGYTRIIKLAKHRIGDGSELCVIQLVGEENEGPQVTGRFSRRRQKANRRMEFAAKLRKGESGEEVETVEAAEADTTTAVAEPETVTEEQTETAEASETAEESAVSEETTDETPAGDEKQPKDA